MFEVDQGRNTYQNITGNSYQINRATGNVFVNEETNNKTILNNQQSYRVGMIIRLITSCLKKKRDDTKFYLRRSLKNVNVVAHLPFSIFPAAISQMIKLQILSPTRDARLIASIYRIFSDFHDPVAEDGDAAVKQKLNEEADKYHTLNFTGQLSKMFKGGTRRKHRAQHKLRKQTKKRRQTKKN